jgi:hypothetical protein
MAAGVLITSSAIEAAGLSIHQVIASGHQEKQPSAKRSDQQTSFRIVSKPARLVSAAGELPETLDKAAIMLKFVGDDQLAVPEVGNRRVVHRTMMQSVRYFFLKSLVSTFQVGNGCLRHHDLRHRRVFNTYQNAKWRKCR